jgi:hypothetical protein
MILTAYRSLSAGEINTKKNTTTDHDINGPVKAVFRPSLLPTSGGGLLLSVECHMDGQGIAESGKRKGRRYGKSAGSGSFQPGRQLKTFVMAPADPNHHPIRFFVASPKGFLDYHRWCAVRISGVLLPPMDGKIVGMTYWFSKTAALPACAMCDPKKAGERR